MLGYNGKNLFFLIYSTDKGARVEFSGLPGGERADGDKLYYSLKKYDGTCDKEKIAFVSGVDENGHVNDGEIKINLPCDEIGGLVAVGNLLKESLHADGIDVGAHIYIIDELNDRRFTHGIVEADDFDLIRQNDYPVMSGDFSDLVGEYIKSSAGSGKESDGVIECCVLGLDTLGGINRLDCFASKVSMLAMSVPGINGIEINCCKDKTIIFSVNVKPSKTDDNCRLIRLVPVIESAALIAAYECR